MDLLFRHHQRRTRFLRASGDIGAGGPPAPSPVGWGCSAEAEHVNCTLAYPFLPDPQDIQKLSGPGVGIRAPEPRLPGIPSPCTDHHLGEGVALFKVLFLNWGERRPKRLKGPRGPGFETLSSQGCLVMGECLSPCRCTGAAGTPADPDRSNPTTLQGKGPFHPSL